MATKQTKMNRNNSPTSFKFFLKSIENHPLAYLMALVGVVLIIWPLFVVEELRYYPRCIAFDLFPKSNGYPSDNFESFGYFIQLPLVLIGSLLIAFAREKIRNSKINIARVIVAFAVTVLICLGLHLIIQMLGFDLINVNCIGYERKLPDLNLIINSRN